jgi:hypothetical protein
MLKRQLKTEVYLGFEDIRLNNASILALARYVTNIERIQRVYEKLGRDLRKTVAFFREIKEVGVEDPQNYVARWLKDEESRRLYMGQELRSGSLLTPGRKESIELGLMILGELDK